MASFYNATIGQQLEFHRVLATAGFTDTDIAHIIKQPSLAIKMYAAIQPDLTTVWNTPIWWVSLERQLERARQLWPDAVLPEPPANFEQQTKTEVLLLHVPDTFDNLWDKVVAPAGYTKLREVEVRSDAKHLRFAYRMYSNLRYSKPVWLGFDPEYGKGVRPDSFWGQPNLAGPEILSALIQFPDWPLAWYYGASAPNLAGYQLKDGGDWSRVPALRRWDGGRQLNLDADWAGSADGRWASPSVREC